MALSWKSFLGWLGGIFRPRPKPPTPPTPPAPPKLRAIALWVKSPAGRPVEGVTVTLDGLTETRYTNADGYVCFPEVPEALVNTGAWCKKDGYYDTYTKLVLRPGNGDYDAEPLAPIPPPKPKHREGIVRADGRHFVDDTGKFFPVGATLFWAPRGWKFERDRIKQNIQFVANARFDYIRILCEVDWKGLENSPDWPDYEQVLRELIDWTYDDAGLRTQLTIFGGEYSKPTELVERVAKIAKARPEAIHAIEVANEGYLRPYDESQLVSWSRYLKSFTPNLVTVTDGGYGDDPAISIKKWADAGAISWGTAHFDRDDSKTEWKWRHVRKPWENRQLSVPCDSNEPGGPRSSVAEYPEAIHLVWCRAVGILCGWDGYLLHNGNGIYGVEQPQRNRQPNLWEIPDIENTMRIVRGLDAFLPAWGSDGVCSRKGLGAHPLTAKELWVDGGAVGVVRDYAITNGNEFWQTLFGIKEYADVVALRNYSLRLIDPVDGWSQDVDVNAGETLRITPHSTDSRGYGAILVVGRVR